MKEEQKQAVAKILGYTPYDNQLQALYEAFNPVPTEREMKYAYVAFHFYRGRFWLDRVFDSVEDARNYCNTEQKNDDMCSERAKRTYKMEQVLYFKGGSK